MYLLCDTLEDDKRLYKTWSPEPGRKLFTRRSDTLRGPSETYY